MTDANGKLPSTKHRCEMRSAHTLRRSAGRKTSSRSASRSRLKRRPIRADPQSCYLNTIRFANGSHMDCYGQDVSTGRNKVEEVRGPLSRRGGVPPPKQRAARTSSGEPNLSWVNRAPEQVVMADSNRERRRTRPPEPRSPP